MEQPQIRTYTATGSKGEFEFEITEPTLAVLQKSMSVMMPYNGSQPNPFMAGQIILESCFHSGDQIVLTDPEYVIGASMLCLSYIKFADVTLKKK